MPRLKRPDGAELHWEARGDGPAVVIAPHAWSVPEHFEPLIAELEPDHRVIRYDARGTGDSSRHGPFDIETGAADLEAMIEHAGGPAVVLSLADGPNYAVRVAAARPDLVAAVLALAAAPIGRASFAEETDALVSSPAVVEAFLEMVATDYRGAMRPLLEAANSQMSDDELRARIDRQVEYVPQDALVERLRAWADDDPVEPPSLSGPAPPKQRPGPKPHTATIPPPRSPGAGAPCVRPAPARRT